MMFFETIQPVLDRLWWNGESSRFDLTGTTNPTASTWPRKKCQDCSGCASRVPEIEVISTRVIEIDRAFHETQTQNSDVKIQIALGIARNRSNVMKSGDG